MASGCPCFQLGPSVPQGREQIAAYISHTLLKTPINDLRLDDSPNLSPRTFGADSVNHDGFGIELAFNFELPHGSCRGHARLLQDVDGVFRALTVMVMQIDLQEHEETLLLPFRDDFNCVPGKDAQKEYTDWVHSVETDPLVLISTLIIPQSFVNINVSRKSAAHKPVYRSPPGSSRTGSMLL